MTMLTGERLYDLLPAFYRTRDAEQGLPLKALLSVIERELQIVEDDLAGLYDNWFIETCDEWVVPYIGDLLGVRGLAPVAEGVFTQRAVVANTIGYRRRKGTVAVLEQLARDITGWPAHAVEFFQLLEWNQYANHVRRQSVRTPDLRDTNRLELLDGPFDTSAHTVDVRHIDDGRGRYNIGNVGLFLWRLQDYAVTMGLARPVGDPSLGRFTFDPLGRSLPLYNTPRIETAITQLAGEPDVPGVLRRRALYDELEARRQAIVDEATPPGTYLGDQAPGPVFTVTVAGDTAPIPPEFVLICNLEDWRRPPKTKAYVRTSDGAKKNRRIRVAVDPVLGRITFPEGVTYERVRVDYAYGFSGDVGGGPYDRRASLLDALGMADTRWRDDPVVWQMGVTKELAPVPNTIVATIGDAVKAWNALPKASGTLGVIAVMDSETYTENLSGALRTIVVPDGCGLLLVAATWPEVPDPDHPGVTMRVAGQYVPDGLRPVLRGALAVRGEGGADAATGQLVVDGLLIDGRVTVVPGSLGDLTLSNSTVVPGGGGVLADAGTEPDLRNAHLGVHVRRCLTSSVRLPPSAAHLAVVDSIVDGSLDGPEAVVADGAGVDVQSATLLGTASARSLDASNAIFRDVVTVARLQTGCVRFSYVAPGSRTPRRYRCQPADDASAARIFPQFTSVSFGDAAYGQLATGCPAEIATGADDEGEMGVFHFLQQQRRVENLVANLDQYLRFGLEAGVFLVT